MKILYAHEFLEEIPAQSIFLAGPSPRDVNHYNWRPEALQILESIDFSGTVFVPLPRSGEWPNDYNAQIEWELKHLEIASVVAFWVPRDLEILPAFTTNVEFGMYLKSGKIVLGFPKGAPKMSYMKYVAEKYQVSVSNTLEDTMRRAVTLVQVRS